MSISLNVYAEMTCKYKGSCTNIKNETAGLCFVNFTLHDVKGDVKINRMSGHELKPGEYFFDDDPEEFKSKEGVYVDHNDGKDMAHRIDFDVATYKDKKCQTDNLGHVTINQAIENAARDYPFDVKISSNLYPKLQLSFQNEKRTGSQGYFFHEEKITFRGSVDEQEYGVSIMNNTNYDLGTPAMNVIKQKATKTELFIANEGVRVNPIYSNGEMGYHFYINVARLAQIGPNCTAYNDDRFSFPAASRRFSCKVINIDDKGVRAIEISNQYTEYPIILRNHAFDANLRVLGSPERTGDGNFISGDGSAYYVYLTSFKTFVLMKRDFWETSINFEIKDDKCIVTPSNEFTCTLSKNYLDIYKLGSQASPQKSVVRVISK